MRSAVPPGSRPYPGTLGGLLPGLAGSATFAFDFGLPPEHAQGQHRGLVGIGTGSGQAAAPVLLIGLCLSLGQAGWVGLGAGFALVGLTAPALAAWGDRTRPNQTPFDSAQTAAVPD